MFDAILAKLGEIGHEIEPYDSTTFRMLIRKKVKKWLSLLLTEILEKMKNPNNLYMLAADVKQTSENIMENFGDDDQDRYQGAFPEYNFTEFLQRLALEVEFLKDTAMIRTYHLKRDEKVHNQFNKIPIQATTVTATIDDNGQVKYFLDNSSISYMPNEFNKSHLKKHYKAVVDFIDTLK